MSQKTECECCEVAGQHASQSSEALIGDLDPALISVKENLAKLWLAMLPTLLPLQMLPAPVIHLVAEYIDSFSKLLNLLLTGKQLHAAVLQSPKLLWSWVAVMARRPLAELAMNEAVVNNARIVRLLDVQGMWLQNTMNSEGESICEFSFPLFAVNDQAMRSQAAHDYLFNPPHELEHSDPGEHVLPTKYYNGSGSFRPQHNWDAPIAFQVDAWLRGIWLAYRIKWLSAGWSTMLVKFTDAKMTADAIRGTYINYDDGNTIREECPRGEFRLQRCGAASEAGRAENES